MKKLMLTLTALLVLAASPAFAAGPVALVEVNGLVCDFCARALEKVFSRQEEVEDISVDLTSKLITIDFHEGRTLNDETITKLVTDAGYNVEAIRREEQ